MIATDTIKAAIWEDGDVTEMARFTINGANGTISDVSTIQRHIFDLSSTTPETDLDDSAVVVATSVFDALQTDARWTKDLTGYNFRDRVPSTFFTTGGHTYRVEYLFTGASAEKFWIVYEHTARKVSAS